MTPFMYAQLIMCPGCPKNPAWNAAGGWQCPLYRDASKTYSARHGLECYHNKSAQLAAMPAKKVNPLKAAKRARRGK